MFNLNWFKNKKKEEELLDLQIKKEKLTIDSIEQDLAAVINSMPSMISTYTRPYKKLKFVNNILTAIFHDGSVINKSEATVDDFEAARNCPTEDCIMNIMKGPEEEKKDVLDKIILTTDDLDIVRMFPDFKSEGKSIYLKGVERSLPPLLVSKFAEIIGRHLTPGYIDPNWEQNVTNDVEYVSLKRFFLWCCLNPRAEVADTLYDFLVKNDFKITKQGFFVALRNVVRKDEANHELVDIISNTYNKVKAVWKKVPSNFRIEELDGEYSMHKVTSEPKGTIIGNLDTLYMELPTMKENSYTDTYTHSFDIRIGQKVTMPPEKCSWSTADCAEAGLKM